MTSLTNLSGLSLPPLLRGVDGVSSGTNQTGSGLGDASAWRRELERAQLDLLFKGEASVASRSVTDSIFGESTLQSSALTSQALASGAAQGSQLQRSTGGEGGVRAVEYPIPTYVAAKPMQLVVTESLAIRTAESLIQGLRQASGLMIVASPPNSHSNAEASPVNGVTVQPGSANRPDLVHFGAAVQDLAEIRLHAEWQGDAVTVWLGISGTVGAVGRRLGELLPYLVPLLQSQGGRLAGLIVNGQPASQKMQTYFPAPAYFKDAL